MPTNGTTSDERQRIDISPNKFLLYGVTYLMATPSEFSRKVVKDNTVDQAVAVDFLRKAGIEEETHLEILKFASTIAGNVALHNTINQLHDNLQSDFGDKTYSPTPCPNDLDSVSILRKMNELRKAQGTSPGAAQPVGTNNGN